MEEGSFDDAFDGCEAVFHTASPTFLTPSDPQAELIDPAVKGTLNVLRSCATVGSIKRVVLTSSMASVVFNGKPLTSETVVDETWFSDPVFCENMKLWYMMAKTLAEEAAWKFANENRIDMVALHPGLVIGPLLQPNLNSSVEVILDIVHGKKSLFGTIYRFTDVRDIALAHVRAYEISSASGRYCLVNKILTLKETLEILHRLFPNSNLPKPVDQNVNPNEPHFQISQEKAKSLDINFTPVEVSLRETVESLREKGLLSI
ncbi:PREDICTED: cinnamoyl-CoA reductase 1-like isoform X2 [Tarenaya hassleriana]|nr:PREDICTED: cinnamoyl-CoA reductase 1-like isoform X2 [Tarenaya hassleriana]XP_019058737.1 PREDICTED: cinnamoyl-CoA reductase 1-like isoform X2 [Tarenaya hassleriana]